MNLRSLTTASGLALALSLAPACHHAMPPEQAIVELHNPNPTTRQNAADSLRTPHGVPPEAVPPLLDALKTEQTPKVRGAILITLGRSGRPEAKGPIDGALRAAADEDSRRWASRALKYWMIETHALAADYVFPDGWPYGQPGYPPPLAKP